jgi:hypothetical protein
MLLLIRVAPQARACPRPSTTRHNAAFPTPRAYATEVNVCNAVCEPGPFEDSYIAHYISHRARSFGIGYGLPTYQES